MAYVLTFVLALLVTPALAGTPPARYSLPDKSALHLTLPAGWTHEIHEESKVEGQPLTVVVKPEAQDFEIHLSPLMSACGPCAIDEEDLESITRQGAATIGHADAPQVRIATARARGYYFITKQASPETEPYRYATYGLVGFDGMRVSFEIHSNRLVVLKEAIEVITKSRRLVSRPADYNI